MVTLEEIQQAFVDEIKRIAANEEKKKLHPDPDIMASLMPPKSITVDYDYLKEMVSDLFGGGVFVSPKNQKELKECVQSLVTALVYDPYIYDSEITIQKGQFIKTPLERLHQQLVDGQKMSLPTYTLNFNLQDLTFHNKSAKEIAKSGEYDFSNDKLMAQLGKVRKWVKGRFNISITIPFASCDLNNIKNDMNELLFALRTEVAWGYEFGDVVVSFEQSESEDWNTRYLHSEHTLGQMKELDEIVRQYGGTLYFSELGKNSETKWTTSQLIAANNQIDELVNTIKENKLSPFEAVVFVCAWASINLTYNDGCTDEELNDTIISAAVTKKIRCVGFSEFVNAVLSTVDFAYLDLDEYPDAGILDVLKICCTTAKDKDGFYVPDHCESQIYIEDKKYGIMGDYFCDVNLMTIFGTILKPLETQLAAAGLPSILPFNPLYLRNLTEFKTLLPEYRIFPFNPKNCNEILYHQSVGFVSEDGTPVSITPDMVRQIPPEQLKHVIAGIEKVETVVSIDDVQYDEYLKKSDEIMEAFEKTQGNPIPAQKYSAAYRRILPLLYPEMKKEDVNKMIALISSFGKAIDSTLLNMQERQNAQTNAPASKDNSDPKTKE